MKQAVDLDRILGLSNDLGRFRDRSLDELTRILDVMTTMVHDVMQDYSKYDNVRSATVEVEQIIGEIKNLMQSIHVQVSMKVETLKQVTKAYVEQELELGRKIQAEAIKVEQFSTLKIIADNPNGKFLLTGQSKVDKESKRGDEVHTDNLNALVAQFMVDQGYSSEDISKDIDIGEFQKYILSQGYDPISFQYIPPQERSIAYSKYNESLIEVELSVEQLKEAMSGMADFMRWEEIKNQVHADNLGALIEQYNSYKSNAEDRITVNDVLRNALFNEKDRNFIAFAIERGYNPETFEYLELWERSAVYKQYDSIMTDLAIIQQRLARNQSDAQNRANRELAEVLNEYNRTATREDIEKMQQYLKGMNIYHGEITGEYNQEFLIAVAGYQYIANTVSTMAEYRRMTDDGYKFEVDGKITAELLALAYAENGLGTKNNPNLNTSSGSVITAVTMVGVGDGIVSQLLEDGKDIVEYGLNHNMSNLKYWTETIPGYFDVGKAIANGEITLKEIREIIGEGLAEEFVVPFQKIIELQHKVLNGKASYEESVTYGKSVVKAGMALTLVEGALKSSVKVSAKITKQLKEILPRLGQKMTIPSMITPEGFKMPSPEWDKGIGEVKTPQPNKPLEKSAEGTDKKTGKLELSDITEEIMATKPKYARIPERWYAKGGHISIDEKGVWTYTNKSGISISYPNGFPDFSKYYHPNVKPVKIEYAQPKNYPKDYEAANTEAGLSKSSNPSVPEKDKPPEGYTWHHYEDGKTMVLVEKDIHDEFKHMGGQSIVNGTGGD
ncbi:hypothetical protein J2T13_001318 [Paenibacillus sp. DS2015]|uniref:HNH endonuclease n=1 Tax=Paenibacillus sp. DS2015 TaxID=3373917 RepID=UPI003D1E1DC4